MREPFITKEEKRSILDNWPTESAAVLIPPEARLRNIEKIPRVEHVVTEVVENFTVELIRAGLRCDIDDRAGITPVLRAEGRIGDLEFVDRIYRRLKRDLLI